MLALLEIALRLGGYGGAYPLFVAYPDDAAYLMVNPEVGRRWFRGGPFVPSARLDFFHAQPTPRLARLVFQGESSALGFPYAHGGAPSRMLEQRLQASYPDRDVEIVNTALTAISSFVLLDQADEIIAQHPEAVLIYTGHNEYYGIFGAGSTGALGGSASALVRTSLALRRLRIVQLAERTAAAGVAALRARAAPDGEARGGAAAGEAASEPRSVMELMAGEQRIPLGSPRFDQGVAQFRANLDALLARYAAARIPVYIGTLVSNERDQPPFVTGFAPGTDTVAWRQRFDAGTRALARGDSAAAGAMFAEAVRIDSTAAGGLYALARLVEAQGDVETARRWYHAARERDELRFRAPDTLNAVIREVAARRGGVVVETQAAMERASPHGIPGSALLLEHLHPNLEGYAVIAQAFYEAVLAHRLLGVPRQVIPPVAARAAAPVTVVDSLAGLLRVGRLRAGWPFQPHGVAVTAAVDTLHPRSPPEALAQQLVLGRMPWPEVTDRLRRYHEQTGNADAAIRDALALAHEYRYSAQPYRDAARVALAHRRWDDALRFARAANARAETAESTELAGLMLLRLGSAADAMVLLERAARLAPSDPRMRVVVQAARALPELEARRAGAAADTTLLYNLALAYALLQQPDRAGPTVDALLVHAPRHPGGRELRRQLEEAEHTRRGARPAAASAPP